MVIRNVTECDTNASETGCFSNMLSASPDTPHNNKDLQVKQRAFALNFVSDPVIQYDRNMNIVWANKVACTLSKRTLKQMIGDSHCRALLGGPCHCTQCPVESAFENGGQCTANVKAHDDRAFLITALPFLSTSGRVDNVVAVLKDETNRIIVENLLSADYSEVMTFAGKLSLLTDREREVMSLMANGRSNKMMSNGLCVSPKTIEVHRSRVMAKLDVGSFAELVRLLTLFEFYGQHVPFSMLK